MERLASLHEALLSEMADAACRHSTLHDGTENHKYLTRNHLQHAITYQIAR